MTNVMYLYEKIKNAIEYGKPIPKIPEYILDNLKHVLFDWQKKAFEYFLIDNEKRRIDNNPIHLMFNMATGSGKTLLMASAILYYYKQGYKYFIFLVNQNNIVDKTENNFIDSFHNKYLFKNRIIIDDKTIRIKKVEYFSDNPKDIEIIFTTIHKLYNNVHIQKENQTTLEDLNQKDLIILADEAHHFNTSTKKTDIQQELIPIKLTENSSKEKIERKGWEHTIINLILNKNNINKKNNNVLLEFTATIPKDNKIAKKYEDKIIYKFTLKEFLRAGYTKEINLISSTLPKKERVLLALLFNWYRHKIAIVNNIPNFKPVILFRSKTIEESKFDYLEFLNWVQDLKEKDFDFLKNISISIQDRRNLYEQGKSRIEQVINFIRHNDIKIRKIIYWIKESFIEKNTIITNSKFKNTTKEVTTEEQNKLLNSLEHKNNHIRAIFTVNRLTEGWDVLNLFDIVRLYKGQSIGGNTKKTPSATTQEKQLIGRGVRYFPFTYKDKLKNKRKFDEDVQNELRILEELFYHTYDEESKYISHLKQELRKDGYIIDDKVIKTFKLKDEFLQKDFYKNVKIWYNKQIDNPNRMKKVFKDIEKDFFPPYKIKSLELKEQEIDLNSQIDVEKLNISNKGLRTISLKFNDIENHIFRKAVNIKAKKENSLFRFENLKKEIEIKSIDDLQNTILANFNIRIIISNETIYDDKTNKEIYDKYIDNDDKLKITLKFLEWILLELRTRITPKIGSEFISGDFKKLFSEKKTKVINEKNLNELIPKEYDWYILDAFVGTSEEEALIELIKETFGNLKQKYDEIYLLRNEGWYKIYDFKKGRGFMPDFILFLKMKNSNDLYFQVFIEPKGDEFKDEFNTFKLGKEGWKEEFLEEISRKYGFSNIIKVENKKYRLIGLPFFNKSIKKSFRQKYQELFKD